MKLLGSREGWWWVLIWKSGEQLRIYASAEIIELPKIIANLPDIGYWIDTSRLGVKPLPQDSVY
ncbi:MULTISPECIES: hypothetical protein [Nostocaceae]|uniref:hypothetical protein n=1 Tax=Nostocaceae TaxID=1162 RepID=UPI0018EFB3D3|nr:MULTISPECIES: hypothetical protein [Nostocaceae]